MTAMTDNALLCHHANARLHTVIDESELARRIAELGETITQDYQGLFTGSERLVVILVLKGAVLFASDLLRQLRLPVQVECIRLASYEGGTASTGQLRPVDLSLPNLNGKHVLIVEDIVDTGLTLKFLLDYLNGLHQARSIKTVVLLDKPEARKPEASHIGAEYVGFAVAPDFLVGYGLDYDGLYRNLPVIARMEFTEPA